MCYHNSKSSIYNLLIIKESSCNNYDYDYSTMLKIRIDVL